MSVNGPISVASAGNTLEGTNIKNLTFSTRYPFAKIDSTSTASFQMINIFFSVDTPNPDGTIVKQNSTLVYQFAHGYKYIPSTWFLVSLDGFNTVLGSEGCYIVGGGGIPYLGSAFLSVQVDATNVYFYVYKQYDSSLPFSAAPTVLGLTTTIRCYVFINDLSGTDVPSQG